MGIENNKFKVQINMNTFTRILFFLLIIAISSGFSFAQDKQKKNIAAVKEYRIGDKGPGGGYVFYDKGSYSDGWRYLEAAAVDQAMFLEWYNGEMTEIGAKGKAVGTGKSNTQIIVKKQGEGQYAAWLCVIYRGGGKSDWFLPSYDELDLMYENLKKTGIVDFSGRFCWSSTETDSEKARFLAFMFGYNGSALKSDQGRVRAVRSF